MQIKTTLIAIVKVYLYPSSGVFILYVITEELKTFLQTF